ncbi:MAG: hypothetical protein IKQ20_06080 [Bacteroidales bacterium]|nr:hypothetical protein [Bacteroidales bacterium]
MFISEDVVMEYSLDEKFTPRDLTPEEKTFLNALVGYTMRLDKSLFFQIADLQRHTKLEFSMNGGRFKGSESPGRDVLEKELTELAKMLEDFRGKLWDDRLPEENWDLYEIWEEEWVRQNEKLKELLDNSEKSVDSTPMGVYYNRGWDSKVVLFVDAIEKRAKHNPYDTMLLMGMVLLHEYFHSFHFHAGTGAGDPPKCIEESMADYGSLVMLDRVVSSGLPIAKDAENALEKALDFVKSKQQRTRDTVGYGFGTCLYENHKEEASNLIALYANVSCLMDDKTLKKDNNFS